MMDDIDNQAFLQLIYGLENIRVYYMSKESPKVYFLVHTNIQQITPIVNDKAIFIHNNIMKLIENKNNIEMDIFYPNTTSKKMTREINNFNGDIDDADIPKTIMSALLLLMKI